MTVTSEYGSKPDYPKELLWKTYKNDQGETLRILGFSPIYESNIKVGVISGIIQKQLNSLPNKRLVRTADKNQWLLLLDVKKQNNSYLCTYETYKTITETAASPIRRSMRGIDTSKLEADDNEFNDVIN